MEFNIISYSYYGTIWNEQLNKEIFMYIIHRNGIIKYNVNDKTVIENFRSPKLLHRSLKNECCMNKHNGCIYINDQREKKIIEFNTETTEWNFEFYHYNIDNMFIKLYGIFYFAQPINRVQFMIIQYRQDFVGNSEGRQINPDYILKLTMNENKNIILSAENLIQDYEKELEEWILRYFRTQIVGISLHDIDNLFYSMFRQYNQNNERRYYNELIRINIAWGQIVFFIFKTDCPLTCGSEVEYIYFIDCIDLFEPNVIHPTVKTLPYIENSELYISPTGLLHYIQIIESEHYELRMMDCLPNHFHSLHKTKRYDVIIKVIQWFARTSKCVRVPPCLLDLLFKFCPKFT